MFISLGNRWAGAAQRRRSERQLRRLDDRALKDIGLSRRDVGHAPQPRIHQPW